MALQKTHDTSFGVTVADAYFRVVGVSLPTKTTMEFSVGCYVSPTHPIAISSQWHSCAYDMTGDNPIRQAYMHLKALPEFADAVDC